MSRREARSSTTALTMTVLTVVVVGTLFWARQIIIPFALAVFMAFILGPAVTRLRRWIGQVPAVLTVVAATLVVVVGLGWFVSAQLASLVNELPDHRDQIREKVASLQTMLSVNPNGRFSVLMDDLERVLQPADTKVTEPIPVIVSSGQPAWMSHFEQLAGPAAHALGQGALSFLLVVFMLLGREDTRNRMIRLIGPSRITATTRAVDDAAVRISRYLRTQLIVNVCFGAVLAVGLLIIGVKYALLWGFVAMVMRYMPYIGGTLAIGPPLLIALTMSDGWTQPLSVLGIIVVLEIMVNAYVEPRFFGQSLGLSELAQVLSAAFWGFLWGPIGLIMAGPLTAVLLVLGKNVPQLKCLDVLLSHDEALPPKMTFYQRLAARDREEATAIATAHADQHGEMVTIESLVMPALGDMQDSAERGELAEGDATFAIDSAKRIAEELASDLPERETDDATVPILVVPVFAAGDDAAADILQARLPAKSWNVTRLKPGALVSDVVAAINTNQTAIVLALSVGPAGAAQLRYLSKRLRLAAPNTKLFVSRLNGRAVEGVVADESAETLADTLTKLHSWRTVLNASPTPQENEPIGMRAAS